MKKLNTFIWIGLLMVAGFLLLADLSADPPGNIDHSAGLVFDPPSKCQAARNLVLYGQWRTDDWTPYIHGALHTLIQAATFKLAGVSLVTMRMPGAIMFLAALVLMAALAGRNRISLAAILVMLIAALNPIALAYGRSGLLEPQLVFWIALSAWALTTGASFGDNSRRRHRFWLFVSGAAAAAAFWTKGMAAYYIVPAALLMLIAPPGRRRDAMFFFLPLLAAAAVYTGPFMNANRAFFEREATYWLERASHASKWALWSRQPVFFQLGASRWILGLAMVAIPLTWRRSRDGTRPPIGLRVLGLMILLGLQATALMQYRPLRYSVVMFAASIPLTAWLIAMSIGWAANPKRNEGGGFTARTAVLWLFEIVLLAYVINFCLVYPWAAGMRGSFNFPPHWRLAASTVLASVLVAAWLGFGRRLTRLFALIPARTRVALASAVWLALGAPEMLNQARVIRRSMAGSDHRMLSFSQKLGNQYNNIMFAGTSPAFAGMENLHKPRKVTHYGLNEKVMNDPDLTHLLIPDAWRQPAFFSRKFPHVWARTTPVDRIVISGFSHTLYALDLEQPVARLERDQLVVSNPDSHNPACVTVLWRTGEAIDGETRTLTPEEEWSVAARDEMWFVPRSAWKLLERPALEERCNQVSDVFAWENTSWMLGSRRIPRRDKPAHAEWRLSQPSDIVVLGIRLRDSGSLDGQVRMTWRPDTGAERDLPAAARLEKGGDYAAIFFHLPPEAQSSSGVLRIATDGYNQLRTDAVLMLSETDLQAYRLAAEIHK